MFVSDKAWYSIVYFYVRDFQKLFSKFFSDIGPSISQLIVICGNELNDTIESNYRVERAHDEIPMSASVSTLCYDKSESNVDD